MPCNFHLQLLLPLSRSSAVEAVAQPSLIHSHLPCIALHCLAADFRTTKLGRMMTHQLVKNLERFGLAPKGSLEVSSMLERAADGLVAGGKQGIFTPLFFFLARKP